MEIKIFNKLAVLAVISSFLMSPLFATNYYVDVVNGNNTNTGLSEMAAFATIQNAANLTNPGDVVLIMNGTYTKAAYGFDGHKSVLYVGRSGSESGGYITYKNYPGHKPKVWGINCGWDCIEVQANYIKIEGIEFMGNNANITYEEAKRVEEEATAGTGSNADREKMNLNGIYIIRSHHVVLQNCIIHDFAGAGVACSSTDYATIENNIVYNNCWYMMYAGSGISVIGNGKIDDLNIYKRIVRGNIVYNNKCLIPWHTNGKVFMSDGNGIILDVNTGYIGRTLVENNVSYNNGGGGVHGFRSSYLDLFNNTAYNNGTNMGYAEIDGLFCTNTRIYNNIMYSRPSSAGGICNYNDAGATYDYNVYYNGKVNKKGSHDIVADPNFVQLPTITSDLADASTADFRLQTSSIAINGGTMATGLYSAKDILGVARPVGASVDMGAYEYGTAIPRAEINIKQATTNILDNNGIFSFGDVSSSVPQTITFTIENTGDKVLNLTGTPRIAVTGTGFSLVTDAPASVPALGTATFQVKLTANTSATTYSGAVSIANNDLDENPYNFTLTGAGYDGSKALQTISFPALPTKTFGDPDFAPEATSSANLPISYVSSNINVATILSGNIHLVGIGTTVITASQVGNATTNPAKDVSHTLTVKVMNDTIFVNKLLSAPTIDGVLSDWGSTWTDILNMPTASTTFDATGKFQVGYTNDSLYVALMVQDATPHNESAITASYLKDCIELFIRIDTISKSVSGSAQYRLQRDASLLESGSVAVNAKSISTDTGYMQEWALPWSGLATRESFANFDISILKYLRFDIQVADNSTGTSGSGATGRTQQLFWNQGVDDKWGKTNSYGYMKLMGVSTDIKNVSNVSNIIVQYNSTANELKISNYTGNVTIFDVTGRKILSDVINNYNQDISMMNLKNGIYIVKCNGFSSKILKW
ncbi:MAG: right-handed parallel beta-helix repeat-containing protein [Salinivirgaceae bacterium]|jgi:parallel beta-helix repeat protein|nr:right-handed parallel beta-helix repeat-containing protein [Salinivirgaceae bacterium]